MIGPDSPDIDKQRHLRALYRDNKPEQREVSPGKLVIDPAQQGEQWRIVSAEYERLYGEPSRGGMLEHILKSAWIEERELAGQVRDRATQAWLNPDGSRADR